VFGGGGSDFNDLRGSSLGLLSIGFAENISVNDPGAEAD
jgi:hypothetical protein